MAKGVKKPKGKKVATVRKSKAAAPLKAKKPAAAAVSVHRDDPVDEIEVGDDDIEFADEHEEYLEKFVNRFREQDLAPKKKDNKRAEKRQQRRQDEQQAQKAKESEAVDAAVAETKGEAGNENRQQQKENGGKKRQLAPDEGLRMPPSKAWQQAVQDEGPVKERLPIKTIEGRVVRQLEKLPTREEQAEQRWKEQEEERKKYAERKAEREARRKEKEEEEAEEEDDDDDDEDGLLDEEVVARPQGDGVTNVSASIDSSLAALRQQEGGAGLDVRAMRQARLELKKIEIATLCEAVLEDPEGSVLSKTEGSRTRVGHLLSLLDDDDKRVQELAIISLLAVFKDIMPTYRIRLPTDKEMATKVSKEIKRLRDYERALLGGYQAYLKHLERTSKLSTATGSSDRGRALVGVRCLCDLLPSMAHFNFATNILSAVVALALKTPDAQVRDACCVSLRRLVEHDHQGDMSLAAAKLICQEVKARRLVAPEEVVRVLHYLKLAVKEDDADVVKSRAAQQGRAKQRKREDNKKEGGGDGPEGRREGPIEVDEEDIVAGLREAEARADPVLRARCQVDALQEVTVLYFRVLKQDVGRPVLLPVVLEGLAKIAHLINLETVQDVIEVLRALLDASSSDGGEDGNGRSRLPLHACLNAVLTALRTLQGPGRELKQDDRAFVVFLYRQLGRMSELRGMRHLPLLITCVRAALLERREYSLARVAAFHKRLCTLALHLSHPREARALLSLAKDLALRYGDGMVERMLEGEADRVCIGIYRPDVDDPDLCNPLAAALWELALLRLHAHPNVRKAAADVLSGAKVGPARFIDAMRIAAEPEEIGSPGLGGWFVRLPKANPLYAMVRKAERDAKGKKTARPYFIRAAGREAAAGIAAPVVDPRGAASVLVSGGLPQFEREKKGEEMDVDGEQDGEVPSFRPLFREVRRHGTRLRMCKQLARLRAVKRAWEGRQEQVDREEKRKHGAGENGKGKEGAKANGVKPQKPSKKQKR